jgi:WD40 repeat protein
MATASFDKAGRVWLAQTGAEWVELRGHADIVMSIDFSPDGKRIVTASSDRTARVWDAASGAQLLVLEGHTGPVLSAVFLPDGNHVATASEDKTARVWDVSMAKVGDPIAAACTYLGNDTNLENVRARFGLGDLAPICGSNPPQAVELAKSE